MLRDRGMLREAASPIQTRANVLDRTIGFFSPSSELRRLQARAALALARRHYEGAAVSRRTQNWRAPSSGPTAAMGPALARLRDRARDLGRNNPFGKRAVQAIRGGIVGTGIRPSGEGPATVMANAKAMWRDWAETKECDADGRLTFYGLQGLCARTIAEAGEVLVRRRRRRSRDGLTVPVQLQVLEPDHLDTSRDLVDARGNRIIQGIQYDALGRREGYWLFPEHPGETIRSSRGYVSQFVPADEILHVYEMSRPGQVRGVPWGCAVLIMLRDFDEYQDATILRQKIAACFAGFIEDSEFSDTVTAAAGASDIDTLEPGTLEQLPPGKKITFANPPRNDDFDPFTNTVLHAVATGYGISYESLTGDYSSTNFASGRMGWLREQTNFQSWQDDMLIPGLCQGVWEWFVLGSTFTAQDLTPVRVSWTPSKRAMVNPTEEIKAQREGIRSGLTTLSETLRENGWEPREALQEMAADAELLDELGLVLDCDPRRTSGQGQAQAQEDPAEEDPKPSPKLARARAKRRDDEERGLRVRSGLGGRRR